MSTLGSRNGENCVSKTLNKVIWASCCQLTWKQSAERRESLPLQQRTASSSQHMWLKGSRPEGLRWPVGRAGQRAGAGESVGVANCFSQRPLTVIVAAKRRLDLGLVQIKCRRRLEQEERDREIKCLFLRYCQGQGVPIDELA